MLPGNFGGNTFLAGNIKEVSDLIEGAFAEAGPSFKGLGSTLEGFDCNPFMYQFIFEKAWDMPQHQDLDSWATSLARMRAGVDNAEAAAAWKELFDEIYIQRSVPGHSPIMNLRPSFQRSSSYHSSIRFNYENEKLREVIEHLLAAGGEGPAYEFDLVNLTRQYLSNRFEQRFAEYKTAYENGEVEKMAELKDDMLDSFDTLDELLASQDYFLVGKWIADARGWGTTPDEADYFESNARNLLTTWGDRGNLLTDYADRSWSGLVKTYYKPRWQLFFQAVDNAMAAGEKLEGERYDLVLEAMKDYEYSWWKERPGSFPAHPQGDPVALVKKVLAEN